MKRVLVTAAASGMGRSIAEAFVEAGERVHIADTDEAASRGVSVEDVRESFLKHVSMRPFVDAADIVGMILFLCSDQGAKISGKALAIDGNMESLTQR